MDSDSVQQQALEALAHDFASFALLFAGALQHPKSASLIHGVVPPASMFVVESYRSLITMFPSLRSELSDQYADLLRASRHRAKLLDDDGKSIDEVADELARIAEEQRRRFRALHTGWLGPVKRQIQPDLGLSTYNGSVFSTTHAAVFGSGRGCDLEASAFSIGVALGGYTADVCRRLRLLPTPSPASVLTGTIELKDIKYEALYKRGALGAVPLGYAAGMAFVLASLNHTNIVLREFLPAGSHTLFRLKFIAVYHAQSSLRLIQDHLLGGGPLPIETREVFRTALGNADSRWLRKQDKLRRLLVHYLADHSLVATMPSKANRVQAIELQSRTDYLEIDALLDRHIAHLSRTLEAGFRLSGNTFWYGRVR